MTRLHWRLLSTCALLLSLGACGESPPQFHADGSPTRLSEWGLFSLASDTLSPVQASAVFTPANQLFTDYAQKLRTLWIPDGAQIALDGGEYDYPVGAILTKTFYYPENSDGSLQARAPLTQPAIDLATHRLIETRLLVRRSDGWQAFPYVWNADETEAFLRVAGTSLALNLQGVNPDATPATFSYFVPNENQCAACHVTEHPDGDMHPLGAIATQLHYRVESAADAPLMAQAFVDRGWLAALPPGAETTRYLDETQSLQTRATDYLNINCGHCHNPDGAADTSALILNGAHASLTGMGRCKPPVAAGGGAGHLRYSIVPGVPDESILLYRMESTAPDEMMPELGRSLVHKEGVALIRDWIASLPGSCNGQ